MRKAGILLLNVVLLCGCSNRNLTTEGGSETSKAPDDYTSVSCEIVDDESEISLAANSDQDDLIQSLTLEVIHEKGSLSDEDAESFGEDYAAYFSEARADGIVETEQKEESHGIIFKVTIPDYQLAIDKYPSLIDGIIGDGRVNLTTLNASNLVTYLEEQGMSCH